MSFWKSLPLCEVGIIIWKLKYHVMVEEEICTDFWQLHASGSLPCASLVLLEVYLHLCFKVHLILTFLFSMHYELSFQ